MNISLRAARRLDHRIGEKLRDVVDTTTSFNIFKHTFNPDENSDFGSNSIERINDLIVLAQTKTEAEIEDYVALIKARSRLRRKIGEANEEFEINTYVAERKALLEEIAFIQSLLLRVKSKEKELDAIGVANKMLALRDNVSRISSFSYDENITVSTISLSYAKKLQDHKQLMAKELEKVEDILVSLNTGTMIAISNLDEALFTQFGLL